MFCAVQEPPSIVEGPSADVKYFTGASGETLELPCRATGQPTPESVGCLDSYSRLSKYTINTKRYPTLR